jgi:RNA methyltransferase, TrmH family
MTLSKSKLKLYRLLQQKKYRDKEGLYIVEGKKMVHDAIKLVPHLITEIICTDQIAKQLPYTVRNITTVTEYSLIEQISSLKTPQETIAILKKPTQLEPLAETLTGLCLVLEDINDPGNMGTIIRLADWFGVESIVCSADCVDCYNPKVVQATMGGIFSITLYTTNLVNFLETALQNNITIYGTTIDGENLFQEKLSLPAMVIMGNESTGISENLKLLLTKKLLIPPFSVHEHSSESLNVSTATAITLSEFRRQEFYSK